MAAGSASACQVGNPRHSSALQRPADLHYAGDPGLPAGLREGLIVVLARGQKGKKWGEGATCEYPLGGTFASRRHAAEGARPKPTDETHALRCCCTRSRSSRRPLLIWCGLFVVETVGDGSGGALCTVSRGAWRCVGDRPVVTWPKEQRNALSERGNKQRARRHCNIRKGGWPRLAALQTAEGAWRMSGRALEGAGRAWRVPGECLEGPGGPGRAWKGRPPFITPRGAARTASGGSVPLRRWRRARVRGPRRR